MKKMFMDFKRDISAVLATVLVILSGVAVAAETKTIPYGKDFQLLQAISIGEGVFALAGFSGSVQQTIPTILEVSAEGNIRRELLIENAASSPFYSVTSIGNDQYWALRFADVTDLVSIAEFVVNGQVTSSIDNLENTYDLFALSDGLLFECRDSYSEFRLEKRNFSGEVLWQLSLAEPLAVNDIYEQNGTYILVGEKQSDDRETPTKGMIMSISSAGEILSRYDSEAYETYIGIIPCEDGGIVIAGNAYSVDPDSCAYSFIAKFNGNSWEWRTDSRYGSAELPVDGYAQSIVQTDAGYLIAVNERRQYHEITLQLFDKNGELIHSWAEPTGVLNNAFFIKLHNQNGAITLIGSGLSSRDDPMSHISIIKPILLND